MRKSLIREYGCVAMLALWMGAAGADSPQDASEQAAIAVVEAYLNALIGGDIAGIRGTLSDGMLRGDKSHVVENRDYVNLLATLYAGASFEVESVEKAPNGELVVAARLALRGGGTMIARLVVVPQEDGSYRIDGER